MVTFFYPHALRVLGLIVIVCSAGSAILLAAATPPREPSTLDIPTLRNVGVVLLGVFGVVGPVSLLFPRALAFPLMKAGAFACAAFANAMTLSPLLAVPFQDTASLVAVVSGLALTVGSLVVYMEAVHKKLAERRR
ncbi:hypothetical protein [Paenarthrobacter sp. NCHU4564]|uniref:hypothetical protein n=1 Tax=Paenarthrobacter sp. NCHU4564 TaxID=3451353 RepID=UPI003F9E8814